MAFADPQDTIVAQASAPGPGLRGIVRLSGRRAFPIVETLGVLRDAVKPRQSACLSLRGLHSPLPCEVYFFPAPRSYTGEDVAEIHTWSSPPLLGLLLKACLAAGARPAEPGEFTRRAFRHGKLNLLEAEAVLAVIEADHPDELKQALTQLAGGMAQPLRKLREDLLDLQADVEAALDFSDDDVSPLPQQALLGRLAAALAHLINVKRQLEQRALAERPFRAVLAGPANAGKSSLFNALLGRPAALVSDVPGTTRDYLEGLMTVDGVRIYLIDTAGAMETPRDLDAQAQLQTSGQKDQADLILWCEPAWQPDRAAAAPLLPANALRLWTKADLGAAPEEGWKTSAVTGMGLVNLKQELARQARLRPASSLPASLVRSRHHVDACLACLRRAHAIALEEDPPELLALELHSALEELGAMVGAVFTEDLLDRIFSRFCIGK